MPSNLKYFKCVAFLYVNMHFRDVFMVERVGTCLDEQEYCYFQTIYSSRSKKYWVISTVTSESCPSTCKSKSK